MRIFTTFYGSVQLEAPESQIFFHGAYLTMFSQESKE